MGLSSIRMAPPPILLVEDDLSLARALISSIEDAGIAVEHCASGELAIELLQTRDFAVAVVDVILGAGISGVYVINAIRRLPASRRPRAIVITSSNVDSLRGLERSVIAAVLLKPLHFALFAEFVLATYRVSIAERITNVRPVQTFCGSCQAALAPWLPERLPIRGNALEMATLEQWLDTPCPSCGAPPRVAGGHSRI